MASSLRGLGTTVRRKAITEIVVEMFLIIVSLIACVVLAGFAFGTMAIYTSTARVEAQVDSCSQVGNSTACVLRLQNTGSSSVSTSGLCSLTVSGKDLGGTVVGGGVIPASGSLDGVECVVNGSSITSGGRISGSLGLQNGAIVYFVGPS